MLSFGLLPMVKVLVSILVVVLLSLIAEVAGPRVAGVVSGYPLGAAISLLFIGIEINPAFAARSAVFTAAGLTGTVAFVGGYLLGLKAAEGRRRLPALGIALLPALAAYGLTAWGLSLFTINRGSALLIAMASMILADRVFRTIPDTAIHAKIQLGFGVTLLRAVFAALVILLITTAARPFFRLPHHYAAAAGHHPVQLSAGPRPHDHQKHPPRPGVSADLCACRRYDLCRFGDCLGHAAGLPGRHPVPADP